MTPLLLFAFTLTVFAATKDGKVLLLNKEQLSKAINSSEYYFALFTVQQCPKCDIFYEIFRQAADMIVVGSPGMTGIPVAKIDLTNDTNYIKQQNIQGFPTARFFANGSYSEYDGEWDMKLMQQWIEDRTGLYIGDMTEEVFINGFPSSGEICLMYFHEPQLDKNDTIPFLEEFKQVVRLFKKHKEYSHFSHTSLPMARERLNISQDHDLVLWVNRGAYQYVYNGEKSIPALYEWLKGHRHLPIMTFNEETIQTIFFRNHRKLPILFMISNDQQLSEGANISLTSLDKQYRKSLYFVYVASNESENQYIRLAKFLGITNVRPPLIVIYNPRDFQKKYRLQTNIAPEVIKVQQKKLIIFKKFIEDFFNNNLQPVFKSQSAPPEQNSKKEIIDVVGTTFQKNVIELDKDVLVYYYATWCQMCQKFSDVYQEIFNHYKDKVIFTKIEAYENEIPNHYIENFPQIKLFKKGKKSTPVEYDGLFEKKQLSAFLNVELQLRVEVHDDL